MLFGLTSEAGFEAPRAGVNDEDGEIGLACTGNHVGYEVPMAGCIEDGEAGVLSLELVHRDVDCDASISFFCSLIQYPCQSER